MAHKITDDCISCGTCAAVCPSGAIQEGKDKYLVDAAKCTDCKECEENCSQAAIVG